MPHVRGRPPRNSIAASRCQDPKGRSSVCWYRRALASRKMQNFVAHLRANPPWHAVSESQRSPTCPFSTVSLNHRLACRRHSVVHPQILAFERSYEVCGVKKNFSGNGDCAVKRAIRAPGRRWTPSAFLSGYRGPSNTRTSQGMPGSPSRPAPRGFCVEVC